MHYSALKCDKSIIVAIGLGVGLGLGFKGWSLAGFIQMKCIKTYGAGRFYWVLSDGAVEKDARRLPLLPLNR